VFTNSVLDTIIAIVVVLLILSLIVQSIQTALKKLFKIKCRQIEDSLVDLFESVCKREAATIKASPILEASPMLRGLVNRTRVLIRPLRRLFGKSQAQTDAPQSTADALAQAVTREFAEAGRVAQSGKVMLDSLNKEDLLKVLERVAPPLLSDGSEARITAIVNQYREFATILEEIQKVSNQLSGDSTSKFAAVQQALAPTLNDLQSIFGGSNPPAGTAAQPGSLVEDLLNLRHFDASEVFKLIGEIQNQVDSDVTKAPTDQKPALVDLSNHLKNLASGIATLSQKLDAAVAPIKQRLSDVESWYDTVMVGFEERYNRSMRTWAIVIGLLVVILLNADFFKIARTISENDVIRSQLVNYGDEINKKKDELQKAQQALADTKGKVQKATTSDLKNNLSQQEQRDQKQVEDLQATLNDLKKAYADGTATYTSFGFDRLSVSQISWWWHGWFAKETDIPAKIRRNIVGLVGWLVTTMLVSVGAPFWQDTLESLFGIKNLLRKKGSKKESSESEAMAGA
jgi:hypothetical protein